MATNEEDAKFGRKVREAVTALAHPAYGEIETLRMMAQILRKPQHGFDFTPTFLDKIADALRDEEFGAHLDAKGGGDE